MVKRFLSYVEIKTKITSIFAFLMSLAYLFYAGQPVNWKLTAVFFISMFVFDLTTTAINNYIDTKTNDQILQFKRGRALAIIYILMGISTASGLYLAYMTDIVVLILGALCFACGVLYTYGPIPISRQPLGELFSGVFYGLFIPFLILYINMPAGTFLAYEISADRIRVDFMLVPLLSVLLLSVAPVCTTANIMLANNICDVEKDIKVRRYTLPYYLGSKAVTLFAALYYVIYLALIVMVILKILPPVCLLFVLTLPIIWKNIKVFMQKQEKATTFLVAIRNYIIIMGSFTLLIFLSSFLR